MINFNSKFFFSVFNNKSTILVFKFSNILVPPESEQKFILKDTFIILQCKVWTVKMNTHLENAKKIYR